MKMFRDVALGLLVATTGFADEGMWTFNHFPSEKVSSKYGFKPESSWLDHARMSSARLARGCSGSFVSPQGLVMTNHHCVSACVEQLSTAQKNYLEAGFYAASPAEELRCPDIEVNQLMEITDVTKTITSATAGLAGKDFSRAQNSIMAKLEKECTRAANVRCDVVTLYRGGQYHLYRYKRFQDVRLVFAPEFAIAFFGGDPDNFNFPRFDLDAAFLRVYENEKPAGIEHFFKWSAAGSSEGELTFVSGHPGSTNRLMTTSQLAYERDVRLPSMLLHLAELRGYLTMFQTRGSEQKRISQVTLFSIENGFKALSGRHAALLDAKFFASKLAAENNFKAKIMQNSKMKKAYGGSFEALETSLQKLKSFRVRYDFVEGGRGFQSQLFGIARALTRAAVELPKPNEQRLREFSDGALPMLKQKLFSSAPIYEELEIALLTHSLTKFREHLGADDFLVKDVMGKKSPQELAMQLIQGTKLKDVKVRQALFDGGQKALDASTDPLLRLAQLVDPEARAIRKRYEEEVEGPVKQHSELLAKAHFEVFGDSTYPDATFTLRLSYGQVQGWSDVSPFTDIKGAFERHAGTDPFALPASWLAAKEKLNPQTPMNFCTTNDIIGGNSGSPVINKSAEIVGLIFDGNIHSLGGDYGFDATQNRAVAVHSEAIMESLSKIYNATRLVEELRPPKTASAAPSEK